jgi:hypothetical protein
VVGVGSPLAEEGFGGKTGDGGALSGRSLPVSPSMSGATGVLSSNSTSREKTVFPEWIS